MRVIEAGFEILDDVNGAELLRNIEKYGRVCYKSEAGITDGSAENFIRRILDSGHESVIEHEKISVRIICDRGVSHEIVRHRIASYSQESTRYCNYSKDKFGGELTVIKPCFWAEESLPYQEWLSAMESAERSYNNLLAGGAKPEEARGVLPNSVKTELIMTMNLREWRHFFILRCSDRAHPQMREIALPLREAFRGLIPVVFN